MGIKTNKIIFVLMVLMLSTMASAKTLYYEDENVGLVTIDVKTTLVEKMLNLLSTQSFSITAEKKSVQVGEAIKVQVITEVPCEDRNGKVLLDSDISVAKFVITDPALSTTNFDIKTGGVIGNLKACQTNQFDFTITPKKEGKYFVHYVVMQKDYPQLLVKEVTEFTSVKKVSVQVPVQKVADSAPEPPSEEEIAAPKEELSPENELSASECTQDLVQVCADSSTIVAYTCSQGKLVPTQEQCKKGDQGAQGEIPLLNLLFSLEFYGIYTYIVIALGMIITLIIITQPKKRGR